MFNTLLNIIIVRFWVAKCWMFNNNYFIRIKR